MRPFRWYGGALAAQGPWRSGVTDGSECQKMKQSPGDWLAQVASKGKKRERKALEADAKQERDEEDFGIH